LRHGISTSHLIDPADALSGAIFAPYLTLGRTFSNIIALMNQFNEVLENALRYQNSTEEGINSSLGIVTAIFKERMELPLIALVP
jgi:hypothetical protein